MEIGMVYKAQALTSERFAKAKALRDDIAKYGVIPRRTFYYFTDMIAEVENLRAEIKRMKEKSVEDSWARSPDRSGGQFSDAERTDYLDRNLTGRW